MLAKVAKAAMVKSWPSQRFLQSDFMARRSVSVPVASFADGQQAGVRSVFKER